MQKDVKGCKRMQKDAEGCRRMEKKVSEQLKDYFDSTPQEQLDKDWEELKHWNEFGPEVGPTYVRMVATLWTKK
jgi:hypothetical protein